MGGTGRSQDIEPLEPELWFHAVERLSRRISPPNDNDVQSMLRHALHLVQLTPGPLKGLVRCEIGEDAFEDFLDRGALDSAAIALVGSPMCYELSSGLDRGQKAIAAKVWLPNQTGRPNPASAESVATALLGAWAACLVALRQQSLHQRNSDPRQFPHIVQPERHPKLSGH